MHILITAGGTREYIDPVRFISNAGSGKMGYALARAAMRAGHTVILITAPTAIKPPAKARVVEVETAWEMFEAVKRHFAGCDCLIMAAAVSDYTPVRKSGRKLKKSQTRLTVELKPTRDILRWAGRNRKGQIVVGFALEDEKLLERAEQKFYDKNLDMIVANCPSSIGADASTVHIKTPDTDWLAIQDAPKTKIAAKIIGQVETLSARRRQKPS